MLGLIDLGAHVGERGLGIEAGLELEQNEAAAFEGGRSHLLHVAARLELGLDRPQQKPFGILRADAALGKLDVDDRNLDVRLRLFRDRHIGHQARAQEEEQRRDGEPRVIDGVVDERGHHFAVAVTSAAATASTFCPSRTNSCPCTITRLPSAMPPSHMKVCASSTTLTGTKPTAPSASTVRTPRSPVEENVSAERGTRDAGTGDSGTKTSAVMPSGIWASAFGNSIST